MAKLEDYVSYKGSLEDNFINEPLSDYINDFVKVKPYDRVHFIEPWKTNIRKFTLAASGYNKIEYLIDNVLLSISKIDKALISSNDKFASIKKAFDDLDLLINNTVKNMNNVFSRSIKKINKTSYYHEKINKMLNLFVKASRIINDDKSNLLNGSLNNINSIIEELTQLLNSTDRNENRIFSKLRIEEHIVRSYNRVVGYRNTERGIAMLHSVMILIIKKMLALQSKKTAKVINHHTNNTNDVIANPIYASPTSV